MTNIKKSFFETIQKGRPFEISARNYKFKTIYKKYSDFVNFEIPEEKRHDEGRGLVVFNSGNFLEIAVYKSNMCHRWQCFNTDGIKLNGYVSVNFLKE